MCENKKTGPPSVWLFSFRVKRIFLFIGNLIFLLIFFLLYTEVSWNIHEAPEFQQNFLKQSLILWWWWKMILIWEIESERNKIFIWKEVNICEWRNLEEKAEDGVWKFISIPYLNGAAKLINSHESRSECIRVAEVNA